MVVCEKNTFFSETPKVTLSWCTGLYMVCEVHVKSSINDINRCAKGEQTISLIYKPV